VGLGRLVSLGAKIGGGRSALAEEAGEDWVENRSEDDLSTAVSSHQSRALFRQRMSASLPELGKGHPQDKDKLEGVVEGYHSSVRFSQSLRCRTHETSRRRLQRSQTQSRTQIPPSTARCQDFEVFESEQLMESLQSATARNVSCDAIWWMVKVVSLEYRRFCLH